MFSVGLVIIGLAIAAIIKQMTFGRFQLVCGAIIALSGFLLENIASASRYVSSVQMFALAMVLPALLVSITGVIQFKRARLLR